MKNDIELVFFNFYYKNTFLLNSFLYLQAKKTPNIFLTFFLRLIVSFLDVQKYTNFRKLDQIVLQKKSLDIRVSIFSLPFNNMSKKNFF